MDSGAYGHTSGLDMELDPPNVVDEMIWICSYALTSIKLYIEDGATGPHSFYHGYKPSVQPQPDGSRLSPKLFISIC